MATKKHQNLLIVDCDLIACGLLYHVMSNAFHTVFVARTPSEAQQIMETIHITHVICSATIEDKPTKGNELIKKWRQEYQDIEWTAILSDEPSQLDRCQNMYDRSIDSYLSRDSILNNVMNFLGLSVRSWR